MTVDRRLIKRISLSAALLGLIPFFQNCDGNLQAAHFSAQAASVGGGTAAQQKSSYETHCAACHGTLASSTLLSLNVDAERIKTAISTVSAMSPLASLSDSEIQAIVQDLHISKSAPIAQCDAPTDLPDGSLFRLTKNQYANVINDLFGVTNGLSYLNGWPSETISGSFENNGLELDMNSVLMAALMADGEKLVNDVWANATLKAKLLPCALSKTGCAHQALKAFLDRAFRRPVEDSQVSGFETVYNEVVQTGDTAENAFKTSLQSVLISPSFVYNAYLFGQKLPNGRRQLSGIELANRMAFVIWGSAPDSTLLTLAQNGSLSDPAVVEAQVKRMLSSSKSSYISQNFLSAWLVPSRFMTSASSYFNLTDDGLKSSMLKETQKFFDDMVSRDAKLTELLTSRDTFLDQTMANHYGVSGISGATFQKYTRADGLGILDQASILSLTGRDHPETNVVHRGKWIMDTLLCQGPPPPVNVEEISAITADQLQQGFTARDMANFRSSNKSCATCHQSMDGFGFTLQNFDSLGRTIASSQPIDNLGKMPDGQNVTGATGLRDWLLNQDSPKGCFGQHLNAFVFGRTLAKPDLCVANKIGVTSWNQTLSQWLTNTIESDGFQQVK